MFKAVKSNSHGVRKSTKYYSMNTDLDNTNTVRDLFL